MMILEQKMKTLNTRAFAVLMITLSGLGLPITGIATHVYGFSPLTVERHAWMSAHNALGILFVVFSILHVIINRRSLWNHVKSAAGPYLSVSREAIFAGIVVALALIGSVGHALHVGQ